MNSVFRFVLVGAVLAVLMAQNALIAVAQNSTVTTNMDIVREKVLADKKFFIAQHMGLKESDAQAFWPVYDLYQQDLIALDERSRVLVKKYAKNFRTMSDDVARQLVDEFVSIHSDRAKLCEAYLSKFREVISEIMVARYYQIENKVQAVLAYELGESIPLIR